MQLIDRKSALWMYLSVEIQDLLKDGEVLVEEAGHVDGLISDYSYLVFPFAKAYEGFLKKLFLDMDLIKEDEYYGDDIRIGRILNPGYINELTSVYRKVCVPKGAKGDAVSNEVSQKLWEGWRKGRNQIFHYFPHNFRKLSHDEAVDLINQLIEAMAFAITSCKVSLAG